MFKCMYALMQLSEVSCQSVVTPLLYGVPGGPDTYDYFLRVAIQRGGVSVGSVSVAHVAL